VTKKVTRFVMNRFGGVTPLLLTLLLLTMPTWAHAQAALSIDAISSRADMASGGDALIRIDAPAGVALDTIALTVNGNATGTRLTPNVATHSVTALVSGLRPGRNLLSATAPGAARPATLAVVNHPGTGPIVSGPHEKPFVCETADFRLRSGGTLGPPLDADCSVRTRVDYVYRSTGGGDLKPLSTGTERPPDLATVTTSHGAPVPYIVRIETGTINRAIYQIAMLHDPAQPAPDFATSSMGWNGRLIYTFGGGCVTGWYRQGRTTGGVEDDQLLRQGYAVASASLNVAGNNCSELLAAETMMMVKERFIEAYGLPLFTIGMGSSGGSYQNHQIADNYPGLLDGAISGRVFPDLAFGTVPMVTDARLLVRYFASTTLQYTDDQKRRIAGIGNLATLTQTNLAPGRIRVGEHCPEILPQALRYDPVTNKTGARCDVYSHAANVYGRDPKTGYVRRPLDNVGVQYGLAALTAGVISMEQFLNLNERIGGFDNDGNTVATRTKADAKAIEAAYRSGRLTNGGLGLASTPIIDYRGYMDDDADGDIHVRYHSFSMRERLRAANGHIDNHVMLIEDNRYGGYSLRSPALLDALRQMDAWLTAMRNAPDDTRLGRLRRARPKSLVDACWTRDAMPTKIAEVQTMGSGQCDTLYPSFSFPRGVAGAPIASDIVKCKLKPVTAADYPGSVSAADMRRLRSIFPSGVCDWSKPGVSQQRPAGVWQTFGG
jgi:Tannase-like family of unknown function (DUF6351)